MTNLIFGFKDANYSTLFGLPLKQAIIIVVLLMIPAYLTIQNVTTKYIYLFIPGLFLIFMYKFNGSDMFYKILNSIIKKDSNFYTKYLTKEIRTINDSIVYTDTEKFSVIKVYTDSYFDKPEDVKEQIRIAFNSSIINYSSNIPKMIFRAINKKLNLIQYFDNVGQYIEKGNPKYRNFFENYSKEYSRIGSDIQDHDYYVELKFKLETRDDVVKNLTNEFVSSLYSYGFNVDSQYPPEILRGDRIYLYIRELMAGEIEDNQSILPIVTEM